MSTGSLGHSVTLLNRKEHPRYIKRISNLLPSLNRKLTTEKLQRDPIREAGSVRFFYKNHPCSGALGANYIYILNFWHLGSPKNKKNTVLETKEIPYKSPPFRKHPPKKTSQRNCSVCFWP